MPYLPQKWRENRTHFRCSDQRSCGTFCDLSMSLYIASISKNLFMAACAVYPYKCADIFPMEISRNCLITGWADSD
jgi:hypothetical protein